MVGQGLARWGMDNRMGLTIHPVTKNRDRYGKFGHVSGFACYGVV